MAKFIGSLNTMQRQLSPAGSTTVSRKLGRMDMPNITDDLSPLVADHVEIFQRAFGRDTVLGS